MLRFGIEKLMLHHILDAAIQQQVNTQADIANLLKQLSHKVLNDDNYKQLMVSSDDAQRIRCLMPAMAWLIERGDIAWVLSQTNKDFDESKYDLKAAHKQCAHELWDDYCATTKPTAKPICLYDEPPATHKIEMFHDADGVLRSRPLR